MNIDLYICSKY